MQCRPPLVVEGRESFSDMVVGGDVCNRPDELALKEVELPGSSRSDPPSGRCVALLTGVRGQGGGALGGAARDTRLRRQPGTICNRVVLRPIAE